MSVATIPNAISDDDDIEASPLAGNFAYLAAFLNQDVLHLDGTKQMTDELVLVDGNNAASVEQVAAAVAAVIPTGVIQIWAGATAPAGWLLCQGQAVSRSTYAALFALIGETYGSGNGTTTFNLPNMKGRVVAGVDSADASFDNLGETGGSKNAVNVSHTHGDTFAVASDGAHTHTPAASRKLYDLEQIARVGGLPTSGAAGWLFNDVGGYGRLPVDSAKWDNGSISLTSAAAHNHALTGSVTSAGESATNKNLQPYIAMHFIIKT